MARHGNAIWVNVKIAKLLKIVIPWSTVATGGNFYIHPDCITIPCHIAVPGAREPCLVTREDLTCACTTQQFMCDAGMRRW